MTISRDNIVELDGVSIQYAMRNKQAPFVAVKNATFDIKSGELVAIVGPSGCGKSSILSSIAGLTDYFGKIMFDGRPVTKPSQECGVVFQRALLLPWRTVAVNVATALEIRGVPAKRRMELAHEILNTVGLFEFRDRYPHELSGGMQQRANLGRALVMNPKLLLLDEPFAALDAQTRELMQEELMRIWSTTGISGLFITHQIDEAIFVADRVFVMSQGPASIFIDEIVVPFERPRHLKIKQEPHFQELVNRVWTAISGFTI